MKLRNLLFGTMIACAFVACSNDDDPIDNGGGSGNPEGKTLLQVKPNAITTKATAAGKDFWVYVIDANGNIVGEGKANEQFELTDSRAEGNVEIIVLKNMPSSMGTPQKKSDLFKEIAFSNAEESDATNSQNTAVYKVSIMRGAINKLGYDNVPTSGVNYLDKSGEPIPAFRNVAKINLQTILIDNNFIQGGKVKYTNPQLEIKEAFILNARNASNMASQAVLTRWATTENANGVYCNGIGYDDYSKWVDEAEAENQKMYIDKITKDNYRTLVAENWSTSNICFNGYRRGLYNLIQGKLVNPIINMTDVPTSNHWNPEFSATFWTYENTNIENPTLLVVKGNFSYDQAAGTVNDPNAVKRVTMENRYYTIKVGENISAGSGLNLLDFGINSVSDIVGIRRNIAYQVELTVKGPGSKNPLFPGEDEKTYMDANVVLVGYGNVEQKPSID
ncbi:hypothetical protein [Parabacteroides gordonii]|jgi:hypothetical protein|uniref:hypothetical protein n=1 Tax=Parabacteroides gordonii TaxID=574930 RepID=UPI00241C0E42|nr:hypothetical protein [Parabacteroides gordonii]